MKRLRMLVVEDEGFMLVVEDEGLVAMLIEDMLDDLGCEVACSANSVAQALKWLDDGGEADAALLDVNLGGETVWPVADALVARGKPFAFTTGYGRLDEPRFERSPVLGKPIKGEQLEELLQRFAGET
ncbi:MAG: response regulator [Caulobacteraceae bacterium]